MWLLVGAIWTGCKWLTWRSVSSTTSRFRSFLYLFAWPGLDAKTFLTAAEPHGKTASSWIAGLLKAAAGAALVGFASRASLAGDSLIVAWSGMIGAILLLHFGLFHLLALVYRSAGIDATPLMCRPICSTSLADLWGNRWNTSFNKLAHDLVFRPLTRPIGTAWATMAVFLGSGAIHDLVISLSARGGYGLPTAYFTLQGLAVLFVRSQTGRKLGLSKGWRGRAFALCLTLLPVPLLFHREFALNVMLPMLRDIGELWRTS
jgi:D-alanyl-lipoteichoic acid acyltransferase DltB (MBOAT superfamily)